MHKTWSIILASSQEVNHKTVPVCGNKLPGTRERLLSMLTHVEVSTFALTGSPHRNKGESWKYQI